MATITASDVMKLRQMTGVSMMECKKALLKTEGDYDAARRDFKQALFLRQNAGATDAQLESTLLAIDAAERRRTREVVAS